MSYSLPLDKSPAKYYRGQLVTWVGRPQHDYQPGRITVVKRHPFGPPIYRVVGLGPFAYYWLEEADLKLAPGVTQPAPPRLFGRPANTVRCRRCSRMFIEPVAHRCVSGFIKKRDYEPLPPCLAN